MAPPKEPTTTMGNVGNVQRLQTHRLSDTNSVARDGTPGRIQRGKIKKSSVAEQKGRPAKQPTRTRPT